MPPVVAVSGGGTGIGDATTMYLDRSGQWWGRARQVAG